MTRHANWANCIQQMAAVNCSDAEVLSTFVKYQGTVELSCSFFPSPSLKGSESGNSSGSFGTVLQMDRGKCFVLEHAVIYGVP